MMSYDYSHPVSRTYQYKKITKPLLERKRRARINRCLEELKDLMVDALETESENISKLEKADILELTVRHLQRLHASRPLELSSIMSPNEDENDKSRWQSGFGHCAAEACKYLTSLPGESGAKLARHLASGLQSSRKLNIQILPQGHIMSLITSNVDPNSNHDDSSSNMDVMELSKSHKIPSPINSPQYCEIYNDGTNTSPINIQIGDNRSNIDPLLPSSPSSNDDVKVHIQNPPAINILRDDKNEDDEEIDVERIDENDPMWRPW